MIQKIFLVTGSMLFSKRRWPVQRGIFLNSLGWLCNGYKMCRIRQVCEEYMNFHPTEHILGNIFIQLLFKTNAVFDPAVTAGYKRKEGPASLFFT